MANLLRTDKVIAEREVERKKNKGSGVCPLCEREPIEQFTYWKIIPNKFPYDRVAKIHEMIVPLRHVTERKLTKAEQREYLDIKDTYMQRYEIIMEATETQKSIKTHFHKHLIIGKD